MVRLALLIALVLASCDMPLQEKYGVHGMITNPNASLTERARRGALRTSHNTVHRRPGTVEPRPGFKLSHTMSASTVLRMLPFGGDILHVRTNGSAHVTEWTNGTDIVTEAAAALQWNRSYVQAAQARGNMYLTTLDAVRKVTSGSDSSAERVHAVAAPGVIQLAISGAGNVLAQNTNASYRATVSRTDTNNVIVTSAPSGRFRLASTNATTQGVTVTVYLQAEHAAGDTLRVYRSSAVADTVVPSDDLRLVLEHVITAAEVAAFAVVMTDNVSDVSRGASLYSNPTREGIERSNIPPPLARDLALYKSSLFAASVKYPPAAQFAMPAFSGYSKSVTRTNASADVVVDSNTNLKVGMIYDITSPDLGSWSGTGSIRITAIVGTTITLSATWNGATDGAPVTRSFYDSVRIKSATEDRYYVAFTALNLLAAVNVGSSFSLSFSTRAVASAEVRAQGVGDVAFFSVSAPPTRRTVRIQSILPSHAGFEVFATNGASYEPALPEPTASTGLASSQDDFPDAVAWSKADEPEHFMLARYWRVGNKTPVLRVVPAGDYLYVFKARGDGIYKLSGYGERSGWRVDQVSADTHLIHPNAIAVHEETVFAQTNRGLVAINEAGVSAPLDEPIADQTLDAAEVLAVDAYQWRAFLEYTRDDEIIMGVPYSDPADTLEAARRVFVYNVANRAWSTWFADATIFSTLVNPADRLLYYCDGSAGRVFKERDRGLAVVTADAEYTPTVSGVAGLVITIAGGSGWTPAVGDLIKDSAATYAIVSAITSGTVFTVSNAIVTGAGTAYKAYESDIEWLPHFDPNGAMQKRYSALYTHWDDTYGMYRWDIDVNGTGEGDSQSWDDAIAYARTFDTQKDTRLLLNADVAFQSRLFTTLSITQAGAQWRVSGITLEARPAGRRVHH